MRRLLERRGIWYFMPVGGPYGKHGIPDFVCCMPVVITEEMVGETLGVFLGVETKAPGKIGTVTANQAEVRDQIREHFGVSLVIDSADDLLAYLLEGAEDEQEA